MVIEVCCCLGLAANVAQLAGLDVITLVKVIKSRGRDSPPEQGGLRAARRTCGHDPLSATAGSGIQGHRGP